MAKFQQATSKSQQQPEFSEVRNCVSSFSRELAVPPSKLVLFFIAAFCRRDQSLSHWRETRFLERAMGIEPTSEAWEASILPLYDARSFL